MCTMSYLTPPGGFVILFNVSGFLRQKYQVGYWWHEKLTLRRRHSISWSSLNVPWSILSPTKFSALIQLTSINKSPISYVINKWCFINITNFSSSLNFKSPSINSILSQQEYSFLQVTDPPASNLTNHRHSCHQAPKSALQSVNPFVHNLQSFNVYNNNSSQWFLWLKIT